MLMTKVKEHIAIWKIPSSNNFVNCHTSYCNEVNTFLKVGTLSSGDTAVISNWQSS